MRLNIGCGFDYRDDWVNIDKPGRCRCDIAHDLESYPWPLEDESVEEAEAIDVVEHLHDLIAFVNECHRVLKPGGTLRIRTPGPSDFFWKDPTHVRPYHGRAFEWFRTAHSNPLYGILGWASVVIDAEVTNADEGEMCPYVNAILTKGEK